MRDVGTNRVTRNLRSKSRSRERDPKAPRNSAAPNKNAAISHEEVKIFRNSVSCVVDTIDNVRSFVVPLFFRFPIHLAPLFLVPWRSSFSVRSPTKHEAPSAKDVGDIVAYVMLRAIRRITRRRFRECHRSGASIFERTSH